MRKKKDRLKMIALYGASFNPVHWDHIAIIKWLLGAFDQVVLIPCGPRSDKETINNTGAIHRIKILINGLRNAGLLDEKRLIIDLSDLKKEKFTPTHVLEKKYGKKGEVYHAFGYDIVCGGRKGKSEMQTEWKNGSENWKNLRCVIFRRPGAKHFKIDLPPRAYKNKFIKATKGISSSEIRDLAFKAKTLDGLREDMVKLVPPSVADYILRYNLYRGIAPQIKSIIELEEPRFRYFVNSDNAKTLEVYEMFKKWEVRANQNMIFVIGGDGTMLDAIRAHWDKHLPFFGINTGHRGYLLNEGSSLFDKISPVSPEDFFKSKRLAIFQMPLLEVSILKANGRWMRTVAFNDAWVERLEGQNAWPRVTIDGRAIPLVSGDGILVSTAAGSTGYAQKIIKFSIPPFNKQLVLAGMHVEVKDNDKEYEWKNTLLPEYSEIKIESLDRKKRRIRGFVDGVPFGEIYKMRVKKSRIAAVELAFFEELDIVEKHMVFNLPYLKPKNSIFNNYK